MKVILFILFVIFGAVQAKPAFLEKLQPLKNRNVVDDAFTALDSLQHNITYAASTILKVQEDVLQQTQNFSLKIDNLINEKIFQFNFTGPCLNENIDDIINVHNEAYFKAITCQINTYATFDKLHQSLYAQRNAVSKTTDDIYGIIHSCYNEDPESGDECIENKRDEINELVNETGKQVEEVIKTNESQVVVIKNEFDECLDTAYEASSERAEEVAENIKECLDNQPTDEPIISF